MILTRGGKVKLFSPRTRLRRKTDFDYVREQGRSRASRYCVVRLAPPREPGWRVAIVVSRYFSAKAVERNRARRRLREACRQVLPEDTGQWWVVIRPRPPLKRAGTPAVAAEMRRLIHQLLPGNELQEKVK